MDARFVVVSVIVVLLLGGPLSGEGYPLQGTPLGDHYAQVHPLWRRMPDPHEEWRFSEDLEGDCEDFAITFFLSYPGPSESEELLVVYRDFGWWERFRSDLDGIGHAVLVLGIPDQGFFVVDDGTLGNIFGPYPSQSAAEKAYIELFEADEAWTLPFTETFGISYEYYLRHAQRIY